jgi:hypothetical protein
VATDAAGKSTVLAGGVEGNDLVVAQNGNIYVTIPPGGASPFNEPSKVWLVKPDGTKEVVDTGIRFANGVTLSPAVVTVPAEGGTFAVRVSTQNDRSWNAKDDATWVSISSGSSGMGNGLVQFTVGSNLPVLTQGLTFVSGTTGTLNPTRTSTPDGGLSPNQRVTATLP